VAVAVRVSGIVSEEREEVAEVMALRLRVAEEGKTEEVELGRTREGVSEARS
jgi:hypothetical protein